MTEEQHLNNWRRKSGLLYWGMDIPDTRNEGPAAMTKRCTLDSVRLLGDFATVSDATWTTQFHGDDAIKQDLANSSVPPLELMAQIELPDLFATIVGLDLLVNYPIPPFERTLKRDGTLFCEYEQTHPNGDPRDGGPGIHLDLSLRVDIYARRTYTVAQENQVLADLNAPRLNRYLHALQQHFEVPFTDIEYEGDQTQIDNNGFIGHDTPPT